MKKLYFQVNIKSSYPFILSSCTQIDIITFVRIFPSKKINCNDYENEDGPKNRIK